MKNTLETRLGLFFALALVTAFILLEMVGGADFLKKTIPVRVRFNNIQELKAGDPVKMAGVQVGRVEGIQIVDQKVEVLMKLHREAEVRTSSRATIKFVGLMGQNFVSIDFGTSQSPKAASNTLLESGDQVDLSTLMSKLEGVASGVEGLTKNFSGENFSNLLGPFTDFLKQNNPKLTAILGNLQNITTQISEGQGTVGKLISDDSLYASALDAVKSLNSTSAEIKKAIGDAQGTLDQAKSVITQINQGQGTLGKMIKDEALYKETTTAMINLREILQKINQGQGSVGKLVNDESFFNNATMTLQKVDKATEGLEDQGPLSVLGLVVGKLF